MLSSRKKDIIVSVELQSRELLSCRVLAKELERRGYIVHVYPLNQVRKQILRIKPIAVINNCNRRNDFFYGYFYGTRHVDFRLIDLAWEQIVLPNSIAFFEFQDGFGKYYTDLITPWGRGYRSFLESQGISKEKLIVTGAPKQSLITLTQNTLDLEKVKYEVLGQEFYKRYAILVALAFTGQSWQPSRCAWYRATLGNSIVDRTINIDTFYHETYCKMLLELFTRYPEYVFILRPHPSKDPNYLMPYQKIASTCNNIVFLPEGDFTWSLLASDLLVSTRSTTLIDAHLAGIPSVHIKEPLCYEDRHPLQLSPFDYFGYSMSSKDFIEKLPSILKSDPCKISQLAEYWLQDWINPQGYQAFINVADAVEQAISRPRARWLAQPFLEAKQYWKNRGLNTRRNDPVSHFQSDRFTKMEASLLDSL